jgi:hypothetical protein
MGKVESNIFKNKKMNKKILSLFVLGTLVLPVVTMAASVEAAIARIQGLAGTIGLAMVTVGWIVTGVIYLTAAGAPEKTNTAKKAMIACIIGTALVALAFSGAIMGVITDALAF